MQEVWLQQTIWTILPPLLAIALALWTKEVYFSLLAGIVSGALMYANFNPLGALETTFTVLGEKVGENSNILIFLVLLGMLVALMNKSGATRAYGRWAARSIKSKRGALAATSALGVLIFVDDYFNCLTVGTVMRPVTDANGISRAKLAYIIDATAAPVCILAPVSSWAAAVGSSLPEGSGIDGFSLFLQTIPFNLYALLTLAMVVFMIAANFDFGAMKRSLPVERETEHHDEDNEGEPTAENGRGRIYDLVIPILVLIVFCILAMLYTGGILEGVGVIEAFAGCDAALSLAIGSFCTLLVTFFLYIPRRVVTFSQFAESLADGFKAMVPAILILTFAWTLSGVCAEEYLDLGGYVKGIVGAGGIPMSILPAIFFLVAAGLAFATGTSWGTFAILIPIAAAVFGGEATNLLVATVSAILAGAVCGDHISPISDTTILSSTGAQCNHIEHVSTQMPYAILVAGCAFIGYIVSGLTANGWMGLLVGAVLLFGALLTLWWSAKRKAA